MASYHVCIKSGKKGKAANHAAYIAREDKHGKGDKKLDLVAVEHGNLPEWANNDPAIFWKAADANERVNGAAYRELEVALPAELTYEQNIALVKELVKTEVGDKPYHLAIHGPDAALGTCKQPHLHLMYSDRKPDGIDRGPELHFRRHNAKHPEKGGCKKDSGGRDQGILKEELLTTRENVANIQNKFLELHGHSARVDHRSHKERGIDKLPERHLGQVGVNKLSEDEKLAFQAKRKKSIKSNQ